MSSRNVVRRNQPQPTTPAKTPRKNEAVDNPALYITRKQAAHLLSITPQTLDKFLYCGQLTKYSFGLKRRKQVRIRLAELLQFMERNAER